MKRSLSILFITLLTASPLAHAASRHPLRAPKAMVASVDIIASQTGIDIMKKGGNAVDAAIAMALVLAVTWPSAGNIGGGGFMLVRRADGATEMIDYRERAPLAATRDMYLDPGGDVIEDRSTTHHQAVAVPGTIAGLALAHKRHGKLSWSSLVEPARKLAAEGFPASDYLANSILDGDSAERLARFPESRRIFLRNGKHYKQWDRFTQPDLARTLKRIQRKGPREFYEGETARLLLDEIRRGGGLLTSRDLREYEPIVRRPLRGSYRGYEIVTVPPPSSGGPALLEMLNILEPFDVSSLPHNSSRYIHLLVETMRRAFADRATYLGDTDFAKGVPVKALISKPYAAALAKTIDLTRATPSEKVKNPAVLPYESPDTTHFTIIDPEGNVVSNTYTLNDSFGAAITVRGAGFLLNNIMDDFTSKPGVPNAYGVLQSEANAIQPLKRPLSSMTPVIVLKDGKVWFALGSPGGPRIITTVLQVLLNVIDHGMDIQQAVDAPRVHHQWMPDEIRWEHQGLSADTRAILESMGHVFREKSTTEGHATVIMVDPSSGMRMGASDPRRGGAPAGW